MEGLQIESNCCRIFYSNNDNNHKILQSQDQYSKTTSYYCYLCSNVFKSQPLSMLIFFFLFQCYLSHLLLINTISMYIGVSQVGYFNHYNKSVTISMTQIEPKSTNAGLLYHHINHTYQKMVALVQQNSIHLPLNDEPTCKEKITALENIIKHLLNKNIDQPCKDCAEHESCIQKLEEEKEKFLWKIKQLQSKREEQKYDEVAKLKKQIAGLQNQVVGERYRSKNLELCLSACENEKKQLEIINQQLSQEINNLKRLSVPQTPRIHDNVVPLTERTSLLGKENGISITAKENPMGKVPSSSLSKRGIAVKSRPLVLEGRVEHRR